MKKMTVVALLTLILGLRAEAQLPVRTTGIFSNMRGAENGKADGTEIFISEVNGDHWALIHRLKYGLNLVILTKAKVDGARISFDMPFESTLEVSREGGATDRMKIDNVWHFEGEFKEDRLIGKFDDSEALDLPRGKSYWE